MVKRKKGKFAPFKLIQFTCSCVLCAAIMYQRNENGYTKKSGARHQMTVYKFYYLFISLLRKTNVRCAQPRIWRKKEKEKNHWLTNEIDIFPFRNQFVRARCVRFAKTWKSFAMLHAYLSCSCHKTNKNLLHATMPLNFDISLALNVCARCRHRWSFLSDFIFFFFFRCLFVFITDFEIGYPTK